MQYQEKTLRNFVSIPKGSSGDTHESCPDERNGAFPPIVSEGVSEGLI